MTQAPLPADRPTEQPDSRPEICILLGLCRSERHLAAQLDSLAAQDWPRWRLIASDDAPGADGTAALVAEFAAAHPGHPVDHRPGPGRGFAANYLALLATVPPGADMVALCDHDDIWLPDKLSRAAAALAAHPPDRPALYGARTLVCDEDLRPLHLSIALRRPPGFGHALVQSLAGANTMVLNRAAADLVRAAAADQGLNGAIVSHDWWIYQIVSGAGGRVIFDPDPVLHYRQHDGNIFGSTRTWRGRAGRALGLIGGRMRDWAATNIAALERSSHRLTPGARAQLAALQRARRGPWLLRPFRLRAAGVYRQGRIETWALYLAALLGRL